MDILDLVNLVVLVSNSTGLLYVRAVARQLLPLTPPHKRRQVLDHLFKDHPDMCRGSRRSDNPLQYLLEWSLRQLRCTVVADWLIQHEAALHQVKLVNIASNAAAQGHLSILWFLADRFPHCVTGEAVITSLSGVVVQNDLSYELRLCQAVRVVKTRFPAVKLPQVALYDAVTIHNEECQPNYLPTLLEEFRHQLHSMPRRLVEVARSKVEERVHH